MSLSGYLDHIPEIRYEGPESDNPFAYRYYDPDAEILGQPMREWLRCAVCFWHTFINLGSDPFGAPTRSWPWDREDEGVVDQARRRSDVLFDLLGKLDIDYYTFHDRDVAPEVEDLTQTNQNLHRVADHLEELQAGSGRRLLWGTSALFRHPRYAQGVATSPSPEVFAAGANQVKEMLDVTQRLGGGAYTMWFARDGFRTLLGTDYEREQAQMARWLEMIRDYARSIGFEGPLFIEPKPREPLKQEYAYDAAAVAAMLQSWGLDGDYQLNIENNHALLAGHKFAFELEFARTHGLLGSIDANRGDLLVGWDIDQFPIDPREAAMAWMVIFRKGGLAPGGLNFDAKLRRESTAVEDLVHAHRGGIDAWARGLRVAARIRREGKLDRMLAERYGAWDGELGQSIRNGEADLVSLQRHALEEGAPQEVPSGQQELWENVFERYF